MRKRMYLLVAISVVLLMFVLAGGTLLAQDNAGLVGVQPMAGEPTPTCDPPCEPVPTPTSDVVWIHGVVLDQATGQGLAGAVVQLYRSAGAGWTLLREGVTDSDGLFGFGISPALSGYRLTETDPLHYGSISATLAPGVTGNVIDANTLDFSLPASSSVGQFVFVDLWDPQPPPTVTLTPLPEGTPTTTTKWVYGKVIDTGTGVGLAGATVRLYRSTGAGWELLREHTTIGDGVFGFGISPALTSYRLIEQDPLEYDSIAAYLPATVSGTVLDSSTIEFTLPFQAGVGEFAFVDIWEGCLVLPDATFTPTSTPTVTPTPTATDTSWEICYDSLPQEVLVYRLVAEDFYGYATDEASLSPLIAVTSPPAPVGWNQPGFIPDSSWQVGAQVWWDLWLVPDWVPFSGAIVVGLEDAGGQAEGLDGITHLILHTFRIEPPRPDMRISSAILEQWSDNKTAWWWDGEVMVDELEGNDRQDQMYPLYIAPEGGTYTLAIQNSNDTQYYENPQGTAYRLCVIWLPLEELTATPEPTTAAPTATITPEPTTAPPTATITPEPTIAVPTATATPQRVLLPLVMQSYQ